jgi:rhamnopyranosyl-N-acetylglucosaminyl-diphospho-decaprenol beta-1,3/1,4-galactofuranosyltransferase
MGNNQQPKNIAAVVVTYNRLVLLKETIEAIRVQSHNVDRLIVIDNGSDDGTGEWLNSQPGLTVVQQENMGGSGGFFTGIKLAEELGCDWIWVMDDDTICQPNTLERLTEKIALVEEPIGFIGSKSIWKDGAPHLMNIPAIAPSFNDRMPFNRYDQHHLLLTETTSFVSLLISTAAVRAVGLPYKEFFIWGDDQEYTKRITSAGFLGFYCIDSIVLHKTGINYFPDFYRDTVPNLWKHNYGFRNEFFMVKKNKGFLYFICWLPIKLTYTSYKIIKIRSDNRFKFIGVLANSAWRSIFFKPQIQKIS